MFFRPKSRSSEIRHDRPAYQLPRSRIGFRRRGVCRPAEPLVHLKTRSADDLSLRGKSHLPGNRILASPVVAHRFIHALFAVPSVTCHSMPLQARTSATGEGSAPVSGAGRLPQQAGVRQYFAAHQEAVGRDKVEEISAVGEPPAWLQTIAARKVVDCVERLADNGRGA